ncbi:Multidrug resistance-associated protein 1 [Mortierella alpina]|nr:Multidrug resistance-associated protein 1 [Mortierella alpina]
MMSLGAKRPLTAADVDEKLPEKLQTRHNFDIISQRWEIRLAQYRRCHRAKGHTTNAKPESVSDDGPSLVLTVLDAYKWRIIPTMVVRLLSFALWYAPSYLFALLLRFFADYGEALKHGTPPPAIEQGLLIATGMFLGNVISAFCLSTSSQELSHTGIRARASLIDMVYRKALRLSPDARKQSTLGEISNHMGGDAEVWMSAPNLLPLSVTIPFELAIALSLLYWLLGWSLLAGLAVFAIVTPAQTKLAKLFQSSQQKKLQVMDSRLRVMTEILSNIKIVKLYAWEDAFRGRIDDLRERELGAQKTLCTIRSLLTMVFSSVNLLIVLATFTVYANWGGPGFTPAKMTPEVVFVGISLFTIMGRPLGLIPMAISHLIALRTANRRIQKFLMLEEIDTKAVLHIRRQSTSSKDSVKVIDGKVLAVEIENGTFAWDKEPTASNSVSSQAEEERQPLLASSPSSSACATPRKPVLSNIDLLIPDGSLTAIAGRVGQGKSSLLSAIIGDMYKCQGSVTVYGDIAFVPQQAWIINATVRDNIILGRPFDQEKYDKIVFSSGLGPDLEMLPHGSETEIGEKGINLSGGQKQRVALARAAYQDADIYLLDDPLSAVDAHVDQHLWRHLIGPEGLLRHKTRLLVTHGIEHLESVDQIVVVKDGMILEKGGYQQLMKAKGTFHQLISEYSVKEKKKRKEQQSVDDAIVDTTPVGPKIPTLATDGIKSATPVISKDKTTSGTLVSPEKMEAGKIGWKVYLDYARAISLGNAVLCLFFYALGQGCQIATNFWLRYWVTAGERKDDRPIAFFLGGYALLVALFLIVDVTVNYMANVVCALQGAKTLHDRLLTRVLRMPMSFFDATPMGRVLNRFSSDVSAVDSQLPELLPGFLSFSSTILGIMFVISYSTPLFLIAVPPLLLVFVLIQDYYVKTSGSLKRLLSVSKSPLYQHFSETLAGVSIIRSTNGLATQFMEENEKRSDVIALRTDQFMITSRWLNIRVQTLCASTVFFAAALAVLNAENLDPSLVGLALTYALNLTNVIAVLVRTASEVQNQFVSVERIQEYSQLPTEAPLDTGTRLPEDWPQHGRVVFKGFSARYREGLDLRIRDATFAIEPQEKIGIVGRTGAGKSSLTLALFRIIEAADSFWAIMSDPSARDYTIDHYAFSNGQGGVSGGSIEIDGIDISTLGLRTLRQHLSIIPQDPTLFAGTVRDNLDPFQELEDAVLWQALERAHLKDHISSLTGGLSYPVEQNGQNFSVGQRSLICLARALLRKTKVLILDEATAAVDVETDDLIQKTIRREFKDRTVLTIAHRIKTVMDSDKILVLEKGRVHEFEAPAVLLKTHESMFYQLAHQAGEI